MHVLHKLCHTGRLLEKVLAGAIDIAFFYGVKLRKQAVFCQKFVYACDLSLFMVESAFSSSGTTSAKA